MVFSSLSFIIFFIPCTAILYYCSKNRAWRNVVLLVASLLFYSWGEPKFVLLMLVVALVAYFGGIQIDRTKDKKVFVLCTILILLNLFVFKYLNFALDNISALTGKEIAIREIALPIGISFYTFQTLSYLIDLYKGKIGLQTKFSNLLLYISFFPQLIAGPIVRYSTVEYEISSRKENFDEVEAGIKRFIIGLAKKVIIANNVAKFAEIVYSAPHGSYSSFVFWLASLAYTLEIYFDFSGYSDMAIGLGRVFGFHFLENFEHPYLSLSVTEFWRRWHISLSSWFRDYVYIPLGGSRVKASRHILNILIVWALTGLWHGASWNFVLWGLYYALLLCLEKFVYGKYLEKLPGIFRWIYTFFIVNLGWVLFNLTDLNECIYAITMMFSSVKLPVLDMIALDSEILTKLPFILLGLVCMLPLGKCTKKIENSKFGELISYIWYLGLFGICIVLILSSSYNPFIYFRF